MVVLLEHGKEDSSCLMILAQIVTQIVKPQQKEPHKPATAPGKRTRVTRSALQKPQPSHDSDLESDTPEEHPQTKPPKQPEPLKLTVLGP